MNVWIVFVEVTVAIHDIFFTVAILEEMKSVFEVLFAFVFTELEHKVGRSPNNNVGKPDGIGARFAL